MFAPHFVNNAQPICVILITIMSDTITNKVAESGLVTLDLEKYIPKEKLVLYARVVNLLHCTDTSSNNDFMIYFVQMF